VIILEARRSGAIEKLKNREKKLFNKTVELLMAGDRERAKIYANEVAFVRCIISKLEKIE
jgi:division protein CdvB (Snf7/Vps24/ESCRT-III family)